MKILKLEILATLILLLLTSTALATPTLNLYMEGAIYDSSSETWTLSSNGTFKLWVLGNGSIYDVRLAAAFSTSGSGTISITPTTATASYLPSSASDPTTPVSPIFNGFKDDGTVPVMGSGKPLPTHDIYGPGTSWAEWFLGDFLATTDQVADMTADPLNWSNGQLNAYDVTITGFTTVHFDAYDHTVSTTGKYKYVKAPFSHDAEATQVPEPSTMMLLGSGLLLLAILGKHRLSRR